MKSELIVDVQPDDISIALTEDGRLQEFNREQRLEDTFAVGNIYYGRIKKVMSALNAVFVDVGYEKEAFLHYQDLGSEFLTCSTYITKALSDRRKIPSMNRLQRQSPVEKEGQISDLLKVGDMVLVQVTKEPINTKGPRLTAELSIAGRNMVLIPFAEKVMVSSKIRKESERSRLKKLVQSIKPQGYGVIVRTLAEDKRVAELDAELQQLLKRWEDAVKLLQQPVKLKETKAKDLKVHDSEIRLICAEPGRTIGVLRDLFSPEFTAVQVNDEDVYKEVKQYVELIAPESIKKVKFYKGSQPIFDKYDITRQMKTGLGRTVGFKHGGYLVIDRTEALFSIDVNSGSKKLFEDQEENAFQYNMLAADEIAHQLRLRDIGGIIIIDFIDMDDKNHQERLYEHMCELMIRDRARHNVLPLSKFGLMQITRQRVRPALEVEVTEVCPTCMGKGNVQSSILFHEQIEWQLQQLAEHQSIKGLTLHLHPYLYAFCCKGLLRSVRARWYKHFGIHLQENQKLGMLQVQLVDRKGQSVELPSVHQKSEDEDAPVESKPL